MNVWDNDLMLTGSEVREFREQLEMTHEELAKRLNETFREDFAKYLNIQPDVLVQWERGEVPIPNPAELGLALQHLMHLEGKFPVQ